mmetsp:Transcript_35421/g.102267  ORF Transcript_35421/g.102267 Transcript_35421/m.102267 type:complete len:258 (-) Transcript_35421:747-1520(-)
MANAAASALSCSALAPRRCLATSPCSPTSSNEAPRLVSFGQRSAGVRAAQRRRRCSGAARTSPSNRWACWRTRCWSCLTAPPVARPMMGLLHPQSPRTKSRRASMLPMVRPSRPKRRRRAPVHGTTAWTVPPRGAQQASAQVAEAVMAPAASEASSMALPRLVRESTEARRRRQRLPGATRGQAAAVASAAPVMVAIPARLWTARSPKAQRNRRLSLPRTPPASRRRCMEPEISPAVPCACSATAALVRCELWRPSC